MYPGELLNLFPIGVLWESTKNPVDASHKLPEEHLVSL